jgi:prophage antirepressor-like protein
VQHLTETFEGKALTFVTFRGEPVVVARELATALGYAEPAKLGRMIRDEWSAEFVEGVDFRLLEGEELAEFKRLGPSGGPSSIDSRAPSLLILTESGLYLVALRTEKALGVKLRRFLATVVLPKLARGEGIPAAKQVSEHEARNARIREGQMILRGVELLYKVSPGRRTEIATLMSRFLSVVTEQPTALPVEPLRQVPLPGIGEAES